MSFRAGESCARSSSMQCVLNAQSVLAELNDERELSTLTRLACGGIAGTTGQTVAYPLDVVRRRMQVHLRISRDACHDSDVLAVQACREFQGRVLLLLCGTASGDSRLVHHWCMSHDACLRRCLGGRGPKRCMQRGALRWLTQA